MDYSKLELLTQALNPLSDTATYYCLTDQYAFCSWFNLPDALLSHQDGKAHPQSGARRTVLNMANARINLNMDMIPEALRETAVKMEAEGILKRCAYLAPEAKEKKVYPSRRINIAKWAITGRCNLRCKHCFLSAPDAKFGELSLDVCKKLIHEMAQCGITRVALTGGEPLVRRDFFELVDELMAHHITIVSIATNGVLVNERFIKEFEERGLKPDVFMSFDGVGWHDWLRGMEGYEEKLMERFALLNEHGFRTGSAMCVHELNKGVLRETINRLAGLGCHGVIINKMTDFGEWEKYGKGRTLDHRELFDAYLDYLPHFFEDGMPVDVSLNRILHLNKGSYEYEMTAYKPSKCNMEEVKVCSAAWNNIFITADGKLAPCISISGMEKQIPNFADALTEGFEAALNRSDYATLMGKSVKDYAEHNPQCAVCPHLKNCMGGCRAQALEFDEADYMAPDRINCTFFKENYTEKILKRLAETVPQAVCTNLPEDL